jgi:hypothetical protein
MDRHRPPPLRLDSKENEVNINPKIGIIHLPNKGPKQLLSNPSKSIPKRSNIPLKVL